MTDLEDPAEAGQFALAMTTESLKRSTDVDACTTLTQRIDERFDATLTHVRKNGAPIACRAGCSFCCHLRVTVVPHEAIALYRHLKSQMPPAQAAAISERVLSNASKIAGMTREQHWATNTPCAFLVDGHCSAYRVRPMVCAGYHSLSRDECEYSYNNPEDLSDGTPMLEILQEIKEASQVGIATALDGLGLSHQRLELHTAVAALLRNPGIISRWRGGRDLVKDISDEPPGG